MQERYPTRRSESRCDAAVNGLTGNGLKGVWSDASSASGMRAVGGGEARFRSRRAFGLVALWALSLGLRVLFFSGLDVQETLRADAYHYGTLAWNLVNRSTYEDNTDPAFQADMRWPPGYPALIAPFFDGRDLRAGTEAALRAQVLIGSVLPLLVVVLGQRFLAAPAAGFAGLLSACCPVLVTMPSFLTTESHFTVVLFLTLLVVARLLDHPTPAGGIRAGLLCGLLALIRSDAIGFPAVIAAYLARRGPPAGRRRVALLLLATAALPALAWEIRNRVEIAHGASSASYFARPLAEGIYPDLRYGNANRGYAFVADPEFPEFSQSISKTLAKLWERTKADPWPNLRWNLVGRWLTLWEFHMIQDPPIHIYPVRRGLFRPAAINPDGRDEPLRAVYWVFRALYYLVVPAVLIGAVVALRRRRASTTPARRLIELLYLVLAYHVALHSVVIPEPRFMVPMRPLLYLLALATVFPLGAADRGSCLPNHPTGQA